MAHFGNPLRKLISILGEAANSLSLEMKVDGADVIKNFSRSKLWYSEKIQSDVVNLMNSFNQSECSISGYSSYATLRSVYDNRIQSTNYI